MLILPWRNAPNVRRAMFTQHEISPEEHRAWFQSIKSDPSARWFLYLDENGVPCGVVYFTSLGAAHGGPFWGFYSSPDALPGTGIRMGLEAMDYVLRELGQRKVNGEVLASNQRSLDLHKKIGFQQ